MNETCGSEDNLCIISFTSNSCSEYISYQLPVNKAANTSMLYHVVSYEYLYCATFHSTPASFTFHLHSLLMARSQKMDATFVMMRCQMHILLLFAAASCDKLMYMKYQSTSLTPSKQRDSYSIDSMGLMNANICLRICTTQCELVAGSGMRKKSAVTREGQKTWCQ